MCTAILGAVNMPGMVEMLLWAVEVLQVAESVFQRKTESVIFPKHLLPSKTLAGSKMGPRCQRVRENGCRPNREAATVGVYHPFLLPSPTSHIPPPKKLPWEAVTGPLNAGK